MEYLKGKSYLKRCFAQIHLDRLGKNIKNYIDYSGAKEICCVVKADAYGHCVSAVAPYLQDKLGIKWFAVSNASEAVDLREMGIKGEILILASTPVNGISLLKEYNLITTVPSLEYAKTLSENGGGRVHIKLDTGMSRIGLDIKNATEQIKEIKKLENISVEGIFTHLCVADSADEDDIAFTKNQISAFKKVVAQCKECGIEFEYKHFLNSAGGIYPYDSDSDLVRLGITQYGLLPNAELSCPFEIEPVMDFKAVVTQVKYIDKGDTVSYGRTFTAKSQMKVATVSVGYADGYFRAFSNCGKVLINGKFANIIGRVCMDQMMIDVTDIEVSAGDVATLFGKGLSADEIALSINTIGYELICAVSKRVPRVIYLDDKEIADFV